MKNYYKMNHFYVEVSFMDSEIKTKTLYSHISQCVVKAHSRYSVLSPTTFPLIVSSVNDTCVLKSQKIFVLYFIFFVCLHPPVKSIKIQILQWSSG